MPVAADQQHALMRFHLESFAEKRQHRQRMKHIQIWLAANQPALARYSPCRSDPGKPRRARSPHQRTAGADLLQASIAAGNRFPNRKRPATLDPVQAAQHAQSVRRTCTPSRSSTVLSTSIHPGTTHRLNAAPPSSRRQSSGRSRSRHTSPSSEMAAELSKPNLCKPCQPPVT